MRCVTQLHHLRRQGEVLNAALRWRRRDLHWIPQCQHKKSQAFNMLSSRTVSSTMNLIANVNMENGVVQSTSVGLRSDVKSRIDTCMTTSRKKYQSSVRFSLAVGVQLVMAALMDNLAFAYHTFFSQSTKSSSVASPELYVAWRDGEHELPESSEHARIVFPILGLGATTILDWYFWSVL